MYAEFCTISNFHIHLHTFKIARSLFFIIHQHDSNHQLFLSNWGGAGGIFNMVWNPHSSLAGCSAGCYAIIFAHFAELGLPRGGWSRGGTGNCHWRDTQVKSPEPEVEWRFFLGPRDDERTSWTFNFMARPIREKVGGSRFLLAKIQPFCFFLMVS